MPVTLDVKANERGTFVIDHTFLDENEAVVAPNAITWTLTDGLGQVVNSRTGVVVSPASTIHIVLSGLDLAVGEGLYDRFRKLLIQATYNSSLGNNLPYTEEITFEINDFTALTGIS